MVKQGTVAIERIGARGDGAGVLAGQSVFVPGGLPGEVWERDAGGDFHCVAASPERAEPACQYFGHCGGCTAQHMPAALYGEWKRGIVRGALRQHGFELEPGEVVRIAAGTRRRCSLGVRKARDGQIVMGYHRAGGNDLIDIAACPVLDADIVARFAAFRALADCLLVPGERGRMTILACREGLDVDCEVKLKNPDSKQRTALARHAKRWGLARLSIGHDPVVMVAQPTLVVSGVSVPVPHAGIFFQAASAAEMRLADEVISGAGRAKRVVDLFCGVGTFALALARRARVVAVDGERTAVEALKAARDGAARDGVRGLKPIETKVRDLLREPLSRQELADFDCAVFDPPRAGAEAQARMLARSAVTRVVAVSCNPGTLARDLRILVDGGFEIERVQPVDQFLFSGHIECVAHLAKPRLRKRQT